MRTETDLDSQVCPHAAEHTVKLGENRIIGKRVEFWAAIITAVCAVASILVGIYQFQDVKNREIRKPLYQEKLKVYSEVTDLLSRMASPSFEESKIHSDFTDKFWSLYQGRAVVVASEEVYVVMSDAAGYVATCIDEIHDRYTGECARIEMVTFSRNFANVVREELRAFWGSGLEGKLSDES